MKAPRPAQPLVTQPLATLLLATVMLTGAPAGAALAPADLAQVGVTPPPGARLPAGLRFVDQSGRPVRLAGGSVPTVLLFADFTCRHVCGPGLTLTAGALRDAGLRTPRDYRLIVIGLDGDGPAAARAMIASHLAALDDARSHVSLLTGTPATIAAAENALGYHAVRDAAADQFAHDAASFVFAPGGALARVLPETAATPAMMREAVGQAARGEAAPASALGGIVALCYGLAAAHGIYGQTIVTALRLLGLLTVAGLGGLMWRLARRGAAA